MYLDLDISGLDILLGVPDLALPLCLCPALPQRPALPHGCDVQAVPGGELLNSDTEAMLSGSCYFYS